MSTVYVLEPPTKGKVVLHTSFGPIDIELWPKEAPKAVRNFVQLCLESYYDNTIFHRVIKGFLVQGGDPTGTGVGGESIYGGPFADEYHSRLRFNHRGLVACANAGTPHSNGSQFFMTLDRCDWLDKKNTIFGKVTGDSLYNLLTLGEVEADKDDRPLDPAPTLNSTEVLWNPFEDIVPRDLPVKPLSLPSETENKNANKKGVKKLSLLSFGEEAEEQEKELAAVKQKIKSSHDVLNDPRLLKDEKPVSDVKSETAKAVRDVLSSKKEHLEKDPKAKISRDDDNKESVDEDDDDDEMSFDARMRQQIIKKKLEMGDVTVKKMKNEVKKPKVQEKPVRERSNSRSDDEESDEKSKASKLSIRKKGIGSEARNERLVNADTDLQLLNNAERGRLLLKQKKRRLHGREDEALAKLERIKQSLASGSGSSQNGSEGKSEEDLSNWFSHKFTPKPTEDKMTRNENPNDYVVHDPLLEKGKQKFNKMIAKQKRQQREWAGKPLL